MIIPKFCSAKQCVEQFYSKTAQQAEINQDDVRLWTAEVVESLNYPLQFIQKVIGSNQDPKFAFSNYKVPLPCDFYKLVPSGIAVNGQPVRWRTNSFHFLMSGDCCDLDAINSQPLDLFTDQFGNVFSPALGTNPTNAEMDITFDISNNEITFNIPEGDVCMTYWSIPVDNEGYIMIPDTALYKKAVTNYLIWCNDYILWRQDAISDKVYMKSESEKNWAIGAAYMEVMIPDVEQTESLKNTVIRLKPLINSYNKFFSDLGNEERLRLH